MVGPAVVGVVSGSGVVVSGSGVVVSGSGVVVSGSGVVVSSSGVVVSGSGVVSVGGLQYYLCCVAKEYFSSTIIIFSLLS